jgi:GAF domain-containing protein
VSTDLSTLHRSLAQVVLSGRPLQEVLTDIAGAARSVITGTAAASVTLIRGDVAFTTAYDGQLALDADVLQYDRGHGPCIDAGLAGQTLIISDMSTEDRWPSFTRRAVERGVHSSLSVPLPYQSSTIGALNTYGTHPRTIDPDDLALAEEIASWVAISVGTADDLARTADDLANLKLAMLSRGVIEQAKGILIERYKVTEDQAFAILSRASQNANIKLREVAEDLVRTGVLTGIQ